MSVATFTKTGTKATTPAKLDKKIFGVEVKNHELLKTAYVAYLANSRTNAAKSKTRGDVRGGGIKPWRQKGTGRARFGSSRNPIWTGGGVAFGPTGNENYKIKLSTASKHTALKQALTLAEKAGKLNVIEALENKEGKVNQTVQLLEKMSLKGNVLILVGERNEMVDRATRNIPKVLVKRAQYLSVFDILNSNHVLLTKDALAHIEGWLGGSTSSPSARGKS